MILRLTLDSSISLEQAWAALECKGVNILYGTQEERCLELFADLPEFDALPSFPWIKTCEPYTYPPIDWQAQWEGHAANFQEGCVIFDPEMWGRGGAPFRLQPGGGFGDLSHPTTHLVLGLLAQHLETQTVIDIGCGSGILSLAAHAMGAKAVYGIDIEEEAVEHSRQNARLNGKEKKCLFFLNKDFTWMPSADGVLMLMNMIRTEQLFAWASLTNLHRQGGKLLTSGIRKEERETYLREMQTLGWSLKEEREEMGWLGFCLLRCI